jgi:hypothetical protein
MNKDALTTLLVIGAIGTILFGSLSFASVVASTFQQRQTCTDKFVPQNTSEFNICIGGMKSG